MKNKKIVLITLVVVAAVAVYGITELQPHTVRVGTAQFGNFTFEEMVQRHPVVVMGEIVDVRMESLPDDIMGTYDNGTKYVYEKNERPNAKITILIEDVLKDDANLATGKMISFHDRHVDGEIGVSNGQRIQYQSMYATDYQVGEKGLFMIENDRGVTSMGYTSYYPIVGGETLATSELGKLLDQDPISLETAATVARQAAGP